MQSQEGRDPSIITSGEERTLTMLRYVRGENCSCADVINSLKVHQVVDGLR